jgi:predicted transcriptional regulator
MRELRAMELTNQGWSQHQIAADLGISQAAVSQLLKAGEQPCAARASRNR